MAETDPFITTLDCERLEGVLFEGFPYLIVHAALGINHIILLPRGLRDHSIQWIAHQQRNANRLPVSLVLSADRRIVYLPDGAHVLAFERLFPGFPVSGAIEACVRFRKGEELAARARALEEFIAEHPIAGFRFGNPWKGGRDATLEEAQWLFGRDDDGVPRGLECCPACGDWKGECLDPSFQEQWGVDIVVPVSCGCENWNRCARCHQTLESYRLNSNFYNPEDGRIWFVAGFCGLSHRCPDQQ